MSFCQSYNDITNEDICNMQFIFEEYPDYPFLWASIDKEYIPYIKCEDMSLCAGRMVEKKFLLHYWQILNNSVFECITIRCYFMNSCQRAVFDRINYCFCDNIFVPNLTTRKDLMISLKDLIDMLKFLKFCETYTSSPAINLDNRCGYINIDNCIMPFVKIENEIYVPSAYFEKVPGDLVLYDVYGDDLWYMKYCCLLLNVYSDIHNKTKCISIKLADIRKYFSSISFYVPDLSMRRRVLNEPQNGQSEQVVPSFTTDLTVENERTQTIDESNASVTREIKNGSVSTTIGTNLFQKLIVCEVGEFLKTGISQTGNNFRDTDNFQTSAIRSSVDGDEMVRQFLRNCIAQLTVKLAEKNDLTDFLNHQEFTSADSYRNQDILRKLLRNFFKGIRQKKKKRKKEVICRRVQPSRQAKKNLQKSNNRKRRK